MRRWRGRGAYSFGIRGSLSEGAFETLRASLTAVGLSSVCLSVCLEVDIHRFILRFVHSIHTTQHGQLLCRILKRKIVAAAQGHGSVFSRQYDQGSVSLFRRRSQGRDG